jgi:hypothetical protein
MGKSAEADRAITDLAKPPECWDELAELFKAGHELASKAAELKRKSDSVGLFSHCIKIEQLALRFHQHMQRWFPTTKGSN